MAPAVDDPPVQAQPQHRAYTAEEVGCSDEERFVLELEFIQCLSNPWYLNYLAQHKYFDDPAFVNYLKYLEYWRQPDYAHFIKYPHCLAVLDLLQSKTFQKAVASMQVTDDIHQQQFYFWQHYRSNRAKAEAARAQQQQAAAGAPAAAAGAGGGSAV